MKINFVDIFILILVLVVMLVPGYILKRKKMVSSKAVASLATILLYCCQPFLTMKSFVLSSLSPSVELAYKMLIMFGITLVAHIVLFFVVKLIYIKIADVKQKSIFQFATIFSNCGFLGIPFVSMLTGSEEATLYITIYIVTFNMLMWTLGLYIITGEKKAMRPAKMLLNPATIVLPLAILLFYVPQINIFALNASVGTLVKAFGDMTTPLSMLIVGIRMGDMKLRELFGDPKVYLVSVAKLVIVPLIVFALLTPFICTGLFLPLDSNNYMIIALIMGMSLPPAASTIAFCEQFGGDTQSALKAFIAPTILSIVVLPIILQFLMWLMAVIA